MKAPASPRAAGLASLRAALPAALIAGTLLLAGCAGLQRQCAARPWLLCGDRITVHRPHVHLDDPAFLYNNRTVAEGGGGDFGFRLSLFFNPHRVRDARMTASVRGGGGASHPCRVGEAGPSPADTAYAVRATARMERAALRFECAGYAPRWGRQDTLLLRFAGASAGPDADSAPVMALPFTAGFHGPVWSFAAGSLLLLSLTAAGEVLAAEE